MRNKFHRERLLTHGERVVSIIIHNNDKTRYVLTGSTNFTSHHREDRCSHPYSNEKFSDLTFPIQSIRHPMESDVLFKDISSSLYIIFLFFMCRALHKYVHTPQGSTCLMKYLWIRKNTIVNKGHKRLYAFDIRNNFPMQKDTNFARKEASQFLE